jgi:hypothetical protein
MLNWLSREFLLAVIISLAIALTVVSVVRPPIQNREPPRQQGGEYTQADQAASKDRQTLQIECNPNCTAKNAEEIRDGSAFVRAVTKAIDDPVTAGILIANFLLVVAVLYQVNESRKSSEAQLRAYIINATGQQFRQGKERGFKFEFRPIILNTGQTPAYGVRSLSRARFMSVPEAMNFDFRVPDLGEASEITLGPRQERLVHTIYERRLSKAELREYKRGEKLFFVYGTTWYRDAFNEPRYTNHCYAIAWFGKIGTPLWQTVARHSDSN